MSSDAVTGSGIALHMRGQAARVNIDTTRLIVVWLATAIHDDDQSSGLTFR